MTNAAPLPGTPATTLASSATLPDFPRARAVEAWLDGLRCDGPDRLDNATDDEGARTLFVLDNDYGELTTVMYLILGQACFRSTRVLVSPRLYPTNHDALPGRVAQWNNEQDVANAIDTLRPRLVVFASGYLMKVHALLDAEALARLCELARGQGAVVATADPFLGLVPPGEAEDLRKLISIDIPAKADAMLLTARRMGNTILHRSLSGAERVLRAYPHLYPTYTDMEGLLATDTDSRNVSFFNEKLLVPPRLLSVSPNAGGGPLETDGRLHWVFIISQADNTTQSIFEGPAQFARIVATRLAEAAELGRHAIFLGPTDLSNLVRSALQSHERIHLLPFCSFRSAMALLLTAEYCFYWNVVSHSILMQLWNGRPVILFDRGHLARAMPTIYERVIAWYYQGYEPPYVDQKSPLSLAALERAVAPQADRRTELMARYRRAPSPADLMQSLLSRAVA